MLLIDLLQLMQDGAIINIYSCYTLQKLAGYNGKDAIDNEYNNCVVSSITAENTEGIAIYIKRA